MEFFGSLCIFSVIAILAWIIHASRTEAIRKNLETVGRKYRGRVIDGSVFENQSMQIETQGVTGILTYKHSGKNSPAFTRLSFEVRGGGTLRIVPEGIWGSVRKMFGTQDIIVGDPVFDTRYVIQGEPEDWVRRFLDADTREIIKRLYAMGDSFFGGSAVRIDKTVSTFTVRVDYDFFSDPTRLDEFVDLCVTLLSRLKEPEGSGVVVVRSGEARGAHCLVCGSDLEGSIVHCRKCRTPHHRDCWNYYGGCAIYGCGEVNKASGI